MQIRRRISGMNLYSTFHRKCTEIGLNSFPFQIRLIPQRRHSLAWEKQVYFPNSIKSKMSILKLKNRSPLLIKISLANYFVIILVTFFCFLYLSFVYSVTGQGLKFAIKIQTPQRKGWKWSKKPLSMLRCIVCRPSMTCYRRKSFVLPRKLILPKNNPSNGLFGGDKKCLSLTLDGTGAKLLTPG